MPSRKFTTNEDRLLRIPVEVQPVHPARTANYRVGHDGTPFAVPGIGGITHNLRVGDPALGWVADHAEPSVTTRNSDNNKNGAVAFMACVGNIATLQNGDAKDVRGFVTGKHGGVEHLMIDFPPEAMKTMTYDAKIRVETFGQGLTIEEAPEVTVMSLDPRLLTHPKWRIAHEDGCLIVPVAKTVPAKIMGSGMGSETSQRGDYDIQLFDEDIVEEYGLEDLRLGDIIAITDADHTFGRIFRTGAISVSVIVHGACVTSGHGPGAMTLFTSATGAIRPVHDSTANLRTIIDAEAKPARKPTKAKGKGRAKGRAR